MRIERRKVIVFAAIITLFTSIYASFLNTIMKQGVSDDHFLINWLVLVPKTYLLLFPFVLVSGAVTRVLVDRIFRNVK